MMAARSSSDQTARLFHALKGNSLPESAAKTMPCEKRRPNKEKEYDMSVDRAVMAFAGFIVLVSLNLGYFISPWWFLLTAFAGLNLMQASVTGFCPAAIVFKKLGVKSGVAFD